MYFLRIKTMEFILVVSYLHLAFTVTYLNIIRQLSGKKVVVLQCHLLFALSMSTWKYDSCEKTLEHKRTCRVEVTRAASAWFLRPKVAALFSLPRGPPDFLPLVSTNMAEPLPGVRKVRTCIPRIHGWLRKKSLTWQHQRIFPVFQRT